MKYAMLIYTDETLAPEPGSEESNAVMAAYFQFTNEVNEKGINLGGEALDSVQTATTVRVRNGELSATDGPFAETKEQLGGFYLIEAADLDEAIKIAARIPAAEHGSVEVRPLWDFSEAMPTDQ